MNRYLVMDHDGIQVVMAFSKRGAYDAYRVIGGTCPFSECVIRPYSRKWLTGK